MVSIMRTNLMALDKAKGVSQTLADSAAKRDEAIDKQSEAK